MIPERFMVRAKQIDNGEWVYGAYLEKYYSSRYGRIDAIFYSDEYKTYRIPIDPETVEPVAVKVLCEKTDVGNYRCPNCHAAFIINMDITNYCGHCGQKLLWEEGDKK